MCIIKCVVFTCSSSKSQSNLKETKSNAVARQCEKAKQANYSRFDANNKDLGFCCNPVSIYKGHSRRERASGDFLSQHLCCQLMRWEMTDTNTDILLGVLPSLAPLVSKVMMNLGGKINILLSDTFRAVQRKSTCDMKCLRSLLLSPNFFSPNFQRW